MGKYSDLEFVLNLFDDCPASAPPMIQPTLPSSSFSPHPNPHLTCLPNLVPAPFLHFSHICPFYSCSVFLFFKVLPALFRYISILLGIKGVGGWVLREQGRRSLCLLSEQPPDVGRSSCPEEFCSIPKALGWSLLSHFENWHICGL